MNSDAIDLSEQLQVGLFYVKIWIFSIAFWKARKGISPANGCFLGKGIPPANAGQIQV